MQHDNGCHDKNGEKNNMNNNDNITGEFIAGFVEGEGCFSLNYQTTGKNRCVWLRPMFFIGLNIRDKELLEKIRDKIGCGRIYILKASGKYKYDKKHNEARLCVYRKEELQNIVIPFFEKYQFHGSKKIAFDVFKKIMKIVSSRKQGKSRKTDEIRLLRLKRKLVNYEGANLNET